ncbi:hypothetical protein [Chryseolinea sp. H1M3-3]|uniref:hypothetical protein n=1 Tax=Chryseolinea sp. H1M3-3 TaxID=3034144 RepID=UPI0023EB0ADE|nr:hypothetical protein [Chryseolinea sp. H1M3-3]
MTNAWQENLNTWVFNERTLIIKKYVGQTVAEIVEYSLQESYGGKFLLITNSSKLGRLTLTVNYENPLPKIRLESADKKNLYIELQAYNQFSEEQKQLIENHVKKLKERFITKRAELDERIFHLQKTKKPDKKILITAYESFVSDIAHKVESIESTVRMTINIASNFTVYLTNLEHEVESILQEIEEI